MRTRARLCSVALVLVVTAALSVACGGSAGSPKAGGAAQDSSVDTAGTTLNIGFQKYGWESTLRARGLNGVKATWAEFPTGPALTEALNGGSIDFGEVGEAPPVFAQAGGVGFKYVAATGAQPASEAVLVAKDSPITKVSDLKGKKVALNKGSNVHYFFIKLLEKNGLKLGDVDLTFIPPADARPAFESGKVDAWVIWDPFLAIAQHDLGARVLADGQDLVGNNTYYLASTKALNDPAKAAAIGQFVKELQGAVRWGIANPDERAAALAPLLGVDQAPLAVAGKRAKAELVALSPDLQRQQQAVADVFFDEKLIPAKLAISDVWVTTFSAGVK